MRKHKYLIMGGAAFTAFVCFFALQISGNFLKTDLSSAASSSTLVPVSADYTGDGREDLAVWDTITGKWSIRDTISGQYTTMNWGSAVSPYFDIPAVGDYDGDGKADPAVWRKMDGKWYVLKSSDGQYAATAWGNAGSDDVPVAADYDGDHKTDLAIWRPSDGTWNILMSSTGQSRVVGWGAGYAPYLDIPVVGGDYDGDGKADLAVWRKSDNNWYILKSSTNFQIIAGGYSVENWGDPSSDLSAVGNYDGTDSDGKKRTDVSIWRPSEGKWYIKQSSNGQSRIASWGQNGDLPRAIDYDGDGKSDLTVLRPTDGNWYVLKSGNGESVVASAKNPVDALVFGTDTLTVGTPEVILTKAARDSLGLDFWPDGFLGTVKKSNGSYDFYAANGKLVKTSGSLTNLTQSVSYAGKSLTLTNPVANYSYAGGGPIYRDPASGKLVMIYHAEHWVNGNWQDFHSWLGMAVSSDDGNTWSDLGTIIKVEADLNTHAEIGGGAYQIVGNDVYVYYHDFLRDGTALITSVAKASINEISSAIATNRAPVFTKYYNGDWTQAGLGGKSSPILPTSGNWAWGSVIKSTLINKYIMATFRFGNPHALYFTISSDGINWSNPLEIDHGSESEFYPTVLSDGDDPLVATGNSFYVYSLKFSSSFIWDTAEVIRRPISITSTASTPTPTPSPTPTTTPVPTPTATPSTWIFCATEGGVCSFSGTQLVRYGANGQYFYKAATGAVSCNNATFGDPAPGILKTCAYGSTTASTPTPTPTPVPSVTPTPLPGPDHQPVGYVDGASCNGVYGWAYDSDVPWESIGIHIYDGNTFVTSLTTNEYRPDVNSAFGLTGNHGFNFSLPDKFKDGLSHSLVLYAVNNYTAGGNSTIYSTPRTIAGCIGGNPTPTPTPVQNVWTFCAVKNEWCNFSGTKTVRYRGEDGGSATRTATGGISCDEQSFGYPDTWGSVICEYTNPNSTTTPTPTAVPTPTPTPSSCRASGASCTGGSQCCSSVCVKKPFTTNGTCR